MSRPPGSPPLAPRPTDEEWWQRVKAICADKGYADWFTADRRAWLESKDNGYTPAEAVRVNVEAMIPDA